MFFWSHPRCFGPLGKFQHNKKISIKTTRVSRLSVSYDYDKTKPYERERERTNLHLNINNSLPSYWSYVCHKLSSAALNHYQIPIQNLLLLINSILFVFMGFTKSVSVWYILGLNFPSLWCLSSLISISILD